MPRVQVQDLAAPLPLQRLQIMPDSYAGVEQPPINSDMERLASALGPFSTALQRVGRANQNISATVRALQDNPDPAAVLHMAATGNYPLRGVKEADDLVASSAGSRLVEEGMRGIRAEMKTGSWNPTNEDGSIKDPLVVFQDTLNGRLQKIRDANPNLANSEAFNKSLLTASEEARKSFSTEVADYIAGGRSRVQQGHIQAIALHALDDIGATATPEQAAAALQRAKQMFNDKRYGAMEFGRMDDVMIGALKGEADKRPDAVEKLLLADRGASAEGVKLGSLAGRMSVTDRQSVFDTILKAKARNFDNEREAEAIGVAVGSLRAGDGSFSTIGDGNYQNPHARQGEAQRYMKADTIKEKALAQWETQHTVELNRQGFQGAALAEELQKDAETTYINNAIPNQRWRNTLNTAATVLANPEQAQKPENLDKLVVTKNLYDRLSKISPGYVKEKLGLNDRAERLMEVADVFRQSGMAPNDTTAMERAVAVINSPKVELNQAARDDIKAGIRRSWLNPARWVGNDPDDPQRPGLMRQHEQLATVLASSGDMLPEEAVKAAGDVMLKRIVNINGRSFAADPHVTAQNKPGWERVIAKVFNEYGTTVRAGFLGDKPVSSASDIIMVATGSKSGSYRLMTKAGAPIMRYDGMTKEYVPVSVDHAQATQAVSEMSFDSQRRLELEAARAASQRIINDPKTMPEQRQAEIAKWQSSGAGLTELETVNRPQWENEMKLPTGRRKTFGRIQQDAIRAERKGSR